MTVRRTIFDQRDDFGDWTMRELRRMKTDLETPRQGMRNVEQKEREKIRPRIF